MTEDYPEHWPDWLVVAIQDIILEAKTADCTHEKNAYHESIQIAKEYAPDDLEHSPSEWYPDMVDEIDMQRLHDNSCEHARFAYGDAAQIVRDSADSIWNGEP